MSYILYRSSIRTPFTQVNFQVSIPLFSQLTKWNERTLLQTTQPVHCLLCVLMHAPFQASVLRPGSQAGPIHETAGMGKLVNDALLSLPVINEACVSVCCATLLLSQLVGPACVQARSSNPRGRACRPSGKRLGEDGILSDVVPVYLYCPAFNVSVPLGV